MHLWHVIGCTFLLVTVAGCTNVDGVVFYEVKGILVDQHDVPVPNMRVAPSLRASVKQEVETSESPGANPGYTRTDESGHFEYRLPAGGWGYTLLLGVIPVGQSTPPIPPPMNSLYIHVSVGDGWKTVHCDADRIDQSETGPGLRRVQLGRVQLSGSP